MSKVTALLPERARKVEAKPRVAAWIGIPLVVLALLFDSPGLAVAVAALIVPAAVLIDLSRRDMFEAEPWWSLASAGAAGAVVGVFISLLNYLLLSEFAKAATSPGACCGIVPGRVNLNVSSPGSVAILFGGIVIPIVAEVLKAAMPVFLRQNVRLRNEVMDGVFLGAAAGGGFAATAAILYFWPLMTGVENLGGSVSGWTAALISVLVIRPLISAATTALVCAGVWHYAIQRQPGNLVLPITCGLATAVAVALGSLLLAGRPSTVELALHLVVLIVVLLVARFLLSRAVEQDRRALTVYGPRVFCPTCGRLTPQGAFCAMCGFPLSGAATTLSPEPPGQEGFGKTAERADAEEEQAAHTPPRQPDV